MKTLELHLTFHQSNNTPLQFHFSFLILTLVITLFIIIIVTALMTSTALTLCPALPCPTLPYPTLPCPALPFLMCFLIYYRSMDSCLHQWDVKPFRAGGAGASRLEKSYVGGKHGAEKLLLKCSWSPDQQQVACGSADRCVITMQRHYGVVCTYSY